MHVPPQRVIRPQKSVPPASVPSTNENARSQVAFVAAASLPTENGTFDAHVFCSTEDAVREHVALVFGEIRGKSNVLVRVHSECITSEVFGSLKCDCKAQLDASLAEIARRGSGAVLYLRQEGRGIGLANKIRAYELQARGHDTVDANRLLGLPDDARQYDVAAQMLAHFDVKSVWLMTNNPDKVSGLRELGVEVTARVPVVVAPNAFSAGYLEAKRARMAHDLPPLTTPLATGTEDAAE